MIKHHLRDLVAGNGSEAVKKLKIPGKSLSKSLIINKEFLRFSEFLNFFTASQ